MVKDPVLRSISMSRVRENLGGKLGLSGLREGHEFTPAEPRLSKLRLLAPEV